MALVQREARGAARLPNPENLGGLLRREGAENPQLDDAGAPRILLRQRCQGSSSAIRSGPRRDWAEATLSRSTSSTGAAPRWPFPEKSVAQYALHLYAASRLRDVGLYSGALPYQQACFADIISFGRDHPVHAGCE